MLTYFYPMQFSSSIFLSYIPLHTTNMEREERRSQVRAEVQGHLGRIQENGTVEDTSIRILTSSYCLTHLAQAISFFSFIQLLNEM